MKMTTAKRTASLLCLIGLGVGLLSQTASAALMSNDYEIGTQSGASNPESLSQELTYMNDVINAYNGGAPAYGSLVNPAPLALASTDVQISKTDTITLTGTDDYLSIRFGNTFVGYDIEGLTGSLTVQTPGGLPPGDQHFFLYDVGSTGGGGGGGGGGGQPGVPDGGMTAGLLGLALCGIGALRRKLAAA
ncbi:MAG: VPDSG-CTERM sorting domain-containing protein [Verrucomicrobiota bacterium]|jgi:hypothetical protein